MRWHSLALIAAAALAPLEAVANPPASTTLGWAPRDVRYQGTIGLQVDVTDVERGIFRVVQWLPVTSSGRLTLLYPKWVPGNHAPTVQIERMAGLTITAAGRRVAWVRDPVDMHAFHVDVPAGVGALDIEFQFLSATGADQGRVVATPAMSNLQWFHLVLYPAGHHARQIMVSPSVRIPNGWSFSTQLPVSSVSEDTIRFEGVDLETLLDSPLFAGRHFRSYSIGNEHSAPATLDVFADEDRFLDASPDAIIAHRRLMDQAGKLFGPPPFQRYRFMLALTRELGGIGTEHLASSEITRPIDYLTDYQWSALLPHELVHAWNGKARRPRDLWSADFNQPMRNSMLWIYEGQTQFWAFVLAARSGLMTRDQVLDVFARLAALHRAQHGRSWRTLADTANDFISTRYLVDEPWPSWHREGNDAYTESNMMWLEADGIIRELSGERRGLDDFARAFFTGGGERASLYDFDDVVAALNRVQPYPWSDFLRDRLYNVNAPADWLARSGYRLVFSDTPAPAYVAHHRRTNRLDLRHSVGLVLRASTGVVSEVAWDSPAFTAGLSAGATILEVNGAGYNPARLEAAIRNNRGGGAPILLKVNSRERERMVTIDYRGGLRFPRLERIPSGPDRLIPLLTAR